MGRASYRDLDAAAEGHASRPVEMKGPFVTTAEHHRVVTDLTRHYENKLLQVRKRLKDPTLEEPAKVDPEGPSSRMEVQAVAPPKPTAGELEALRARAGELGVQYGLKWDETRLKAEIDRAEKAKSAKTSKPAGKSSGKNR